MMGTNNQWTECFVTGTHNNGISYQVVFGSTGKSMRCNRSHLRPHGIDLPQISDRYQESVCDLVPSGGEVLKENSVLSEQEADPEKREQISTENLACEDHHLIQKEILL